MREEVKGFLAECKKRGIVVCLITDLTSAIQFRKIQRLGLSGLFDFVVTSEEAGVEKPEPFIFSYAVKKMGLHLRDVVMIGDDSKKDIDGARNHNIKTFQVF
jgi:putative hydrolase of the HAD superfamily